MVTVGLPRRAVALAGFVVVLAVGVFLATSGPDGPTTWVDGRSPSRVEARLVVDAAPVRTSDPYRGLGTWVDAYDFDPAYVPGAVTVRPVDVADMADHGVRTLYLQSSRSDSRATGLVADPWLMGGFLLAGDRADVDVVAWYHPK